jgi:hypothetical protein
MPGKNFAELKLAEPLDDHTKWFEDPDDPAITLPSIQWDHDDDESDPLASRRLSNGFVIPANQWTTAVSPEDVVEHRPEESRPLIEELDEATRTPITLCIGDVETREVEWLWEGWVVRNAINLLDGDPGILKTFVALYLCAAVSRGRPMPGDEGRSDLARGPIIYLSSEDRAETTLRPRLLAADADPSRCHALDPTVEVDGEPYFFDLGDMDRFEAEIQALRPALIVLDPLMGLFPMGSQTNAETEVRPVLRRLDALCEKYSFTILAIRHCRKADTKAAVLAGGGSVGISAHARSVLFMGKDPKNPGASIITVAKNNHAKTPTSLTCEVINGVFQFTGTSMLTADMLAQSRGEVANSKTDDAKKWLVDRLQRRSVLVKTLMAEGEAAGFSRRTLERAKKELSGFVLAHGSNAKRQWALQSYVEAEREETLDNVAALPMQPESEAADDEDDDRIEMADDEWDALMEKVHGGEG